jgi:putative chitinase
MIPTMADLRAAKIKNPENWIDAVVATCEEFEINTPQRVAAFLSQTSHESGGYTMLKENLNYRATTLAACWPHRFAVQEPDPNKPGKTRAKKDAKGANIPTAVANAIAGKPEAIANMVYSGRMGNGPAESGEGFLYIGRGIKQLTGKDNYTRCGAALGLDLVGNPDLLLETLPAARSAGWFWKTNNLSKFADVEDIKGMTKVINGGYIGLEARQALYDACYGQCRA